MNVVADQSHSLYHTVTIGRHRLASSIMSFWISMMGFCSCGSEAKEGVGERERPQVSILAFGMMPLNAR